LRRELCQLDSLIAVSAIEAGCWGWRWRWRAIRVSAIAWLGGGFCGLRVSLLRNPPSEAVRFIISESKEILQWLFGSNLLLTLLRMSFLGIIYVYIVFSTCLDSEAVLVRFIEDFNYSFIVILNQSSVMHQLNASFCQLSCSTLCPVIHHSKLFATFCISHGNC